MYKEFHIYLKYCKTFGGIDKSIWGYTFKL